MKNPFERISSCWVSHSDYEWRESADGHLYLIPTANSQPTITDPMEDGEALVLAAMDIGMMLMRKAPEEQVKAAIREFALKYGLLGIMTALPTTVKFIEYEKVYLPKNQLIRAESLDTIEYLKYFYPIKMPDFVKKGMESTWEVTGKEMAALVMTFNSAPQAVVMNFMREYGERYDWLTAVFKDLAFTFLTTVLYYNDKKNLDEETLDIYRKGMAAFDGNAPTYHIELRDKPTIVWDFHSLLLCVKLMMSFMITDDERPMKLCRHCQRPFITKRSNAEFCSRKCKEKGLQL